MTGAVVLVVDDNALNAKLTRLLLAGKGFVVHTAANAEEALQTLQMVTPDLILMDLQLPGMDGFELTRRLKQDPATHQIRIVALTAYAMKGDEQRAADAGCDGYISKPIDTRNLPSLVAKYIESAR
jgi:CheY-like chemotaxis protein